MPELTRRRDLKAPDECWHVYYGDVRAGTMAKRVGIPFDEDPWGWVCGFYPECHPLERADGVVAIFDHARAEFEEARTIFLSNRTEADFEEWRHQRDWTARKYAVWAAGEKMPSQRPNTLMCCPRDKTFDSHRLSLVASIFPEEDQNGPF
jgi:hypothetical protein